MSKLTDESIMPFGKYQGQKMANVPAWYLLWMNANNKLFGPVKDYVEENKDILQQEADGKLKR